MPALDIRPLNSKLEVIVHDQLHEVPDKIHEYLDILKEWIKKSTHLKARADDQFLVTFLRGTKYSIENAKEKIDMFYTLRTHLPEMIYDRDPMNEKLRCVIKQGIILPFSETEDIGSPNTLFVRLGIYDPNKIHMVEIMKLYTMISDILMAEDDNLAVSGQIIICDLKDVSLALFAQLTPQFLKKAIMMWQDGMSIRQEGVHYINAPSTFEAIFKLAKSLMNEKMRSRLFVHSSMDSFYKTFPRKLMPVEYEGEGDNLQDLTDFWEKKILSYREYFLEESQQYGVDEKKRIGQPKTSETLFGFDGTFEQLEFDSVTNFT